MLFETYYTATSVYHARLADLVSGVSSQGRLSFLCVSKFENILYLSENMVYGFHICATKCSICDVSQSNTWTFLAHNLQSSFTFKSLDLQDRDVHEMKSIVTTMHGDWPHWSNFLLLTCFLAAFPCLFSFHLSKLMVLIKCSNLFN